MHFNRAGELIRNCSLIQFQALCELRCLYVAKRHVIIFLRTVPYWETSKTEELAGKCYKVTGITDVLSGNFRLG